MSANVDFASLVVKANSTELKQLRNVMREVDGQAKKTEKSTGMLSGAFGKLAAAAGAYFGIRKGIDIFKDLTRAGSDLYETVNKGAVVLGDSFSEVEKFADNAAASLGQSKKEAIDAASTFGIFGKSAGLAGKDLGDFSIQFTKLASDFASFYNTSPEDAITAIGAAMRGEQEPIRRYGILLDEATLRQAALEAGIVSTTKKALTPQQRVLAASKEIMKQSSDAQGDFARTSDGLANKQRILAATIEDTKAALGEGLIPIMDQFLELSLKIAGSKKLTSFFKDLIKGVSIEIDLLTGKSIDYIKTTRSISDAMKEGGETGEKILSLRLTELNQKWEETNQKIKDVQNPSTVLGKIWQKMGGSKFGDDLEKYKKELKEIEEQTVLIGRAMAGGDNVPGTDSGATTNKKTATEDTSWKDLKDALGAEWLDIHNKKLEITKKSNEAIKAENDRKLQEDIERDTIYRQLIDEARVAEIENIQNEVEKEIALHEYKFQRLKELYEEGSEELTAIERIENAERQKLILRTKKIQDENNMAALSSAEKMFGGIMEATYKFGGEQTAFYKTMFVMKKSIALAESIMAIATGLAESSKVGWPQNLITMAGHIVTTAGIIGEIAAVNFSGAKDRGGTIPAGTWGIAGEYGPEIVQGPANVISRVDTANMLNGNTTSNNQRPIEFHTHITVTGNFIGNNAAMRDLAKEVNLQMQNELTRLGAVI